MVTADTGGMDTATAPLVTVEVTEEVSVEVTVEATVEATVEVMVVLAANTKCNERRRRLFGAFSPFFSLFDVYSVIH